MIKLLMVFTVENLEQSRIKGLDSLELIFKIADRIFTQTVFNKEQLPIGNCCLACYYFLYYRQLPFRECISEHSSKKYKVTPG